ncbi:hypothetical protein MLD38_007493 [Melastoma candidum]|uniref:Uncharacterized protein n=1 Tax=Melastoma candidum TaxID=119954 RepID=A0ACB9RSJ8_9MYRT|nr:hypothetical protein MLD38_007493 [Melastoma candidum]
MPCDVHRITRVGIGLTRQPAIRTSFRFFAKKKRFPFYLGIESAFGCYLLETLYQTCCRSAVWDLGMALRSAGMKNCLQSYSTICIHHFRRAAGFQLQREYSSHHLTDDDDDDKFAELGSPLACGLQRPLKLMTEKTDWIKKKNGSRWSTPDICSSSSEEAIAMAEMELKAMCSDILGLDDAVDGTDAINARTTFITIANIPPSIKLSEVVKALSSFGKISNSSVRTSPDGKACCDVYFEREEANQKALSAGVITVNDVHLPINPGRDMVTIRIVNVSCKTLDSVVHAICRSCGFLVKVVRIDENTLDAFFGVENKSDAKSILKRLNYTIMDDCNWLATLQSGDHTAPASTSNHQERNDVSCNSGLKIGQHIAELKQLHSTKKMNIEDLDNLCAAILHIESRNAALKEQN